MQQESFFITYLQLKDYFINRMFDWFYYNLECHYNNWKFCLVSRKRTWSHVSCRCNKVILLQCNTANQGDFTDLKETIISGQMISCEMVFAKYDFPSIELNKGLPRPWRNLKRSVVSYTRICIFFRETRFRDVESLFPAAFDLDRRRRESGEIGHKFYQPCPRPACP